MSAAALLHTLTFTCPACGATEPGASVRFRCACGTPFDLAPAALPLDPLDAATLRERFARRLGALTGSARSGVWRYCELVLPLPEEAIVTRAEGNTPLHAVGASSSDAGWRRIGEFAGLERLWLKHEGENPTGSFKDRGMTVGMSVARALGARAVACASTGNTSASLAAYAAQAGLPALVFLPAEKVAGGKLAQSVAYGALRVEVAGDFDTAMRHVEAVADELGIYLLNSINPYRLAGQRSIGYELLQQLGWAAPDWVVLPAGNLGNTSAIGAALIRAHELGLIDHLPRIAAIQASGAAPFYQSYAGGWREHTPVRASTRATAINIGAPVSYARARAVIDTTAGVVEQASDEEIFAAKAIIDRAGIGCEPASAASLAGARKLRAAGVIAPDARVVAILTGHLLKDTAQATGEPADQPPEVMALLDEVRGALARIAG
ncbi:MAG: threonine synthase [Chloroflexota bacterium]|nr:threonine synthase [Chloroflexota bacterium]